MWVAIMRYFLLTIVCVIAVNGRPQESRQYPVRLQPELDALDVEQYFKNERLMELQIKCVVYDGPCDAVGRWVKPRVAAAFNGECPLCTPMQMKNVERLVAFIKEKRPDVYKAAEAKFANKN